MTRNRQIKQSDRESLYPWELSDSDLQALEVSEPPDSSAQFDHDKAVADNKALPGRGEVALTSSSVAKRLTAGGAAKLLRRLGLRTAVPPSALLSVTL